MDWTENEYKKKPKQLMSKEKLGKRLLKSFKHYSLSERNPDVGGEKNGEGSSQRGGCSD